VPNNATAVVLNVTGVGATAGTHVTVWPAGQPQPLASNLNLPAGATRPNLVVVAVGANGQVSLFNNAGSLHLLADVVGYFAPDATGGLYTGITPKRVVDSRDGTGTAIGPWGASETRELTVTGGLTTVPADATGVILNVTATGPSASTHLTVWPEGEDMPLASNLNVAPGSTVANLVMAKVGPTGEVQLFNNSGSAHVIVDVVGYYRLASGGSFTGVAPYRLLDSRDGTGGSSTAWAGGETRSLVVSGGTTTVPADATAVVLNVTAVNPSTGTHITVWPGGETMPLASNLNLPARDVRPNLVVVKVGAGGQVQLFNNAGSTHLLADVVGYFR
jgi:hypothetical protein